MNWLKESVCRFLWTLCGVSSYGDATTSSGVVRIAKESDDLIEGKDVLIVEDIIDSGRTLYISDRCI